MAFAVYMGELNTNNDLRTTYLLFCANRKRKEVKVTCSHPPRRRFDISCVVIYYTTHHPKGSYTYKKMNI
jgi:hypothetical protein